MQCLNMGKEETKMSLRHIGYLFRNLNHSDKNHSGCRGSLIIGWLKITMYS